MKIYKILIVRLKDNRNITSEITSTDSRKTTTSGMKFFKCEEKKFCKKIKHEKNF